MSIKNDVEVIINGKVYRLSGYESEEYLQKIASYINNKINFFAEQESYTRLNAEMKNTLLCINLADDYFKVKKQADSIENTSESRDRQLYDVKHELADARLKIDTLEREMTMLRDKLSEQEKENIRLGAELESTKNIMDAAIASKKESIVLPEQEESDETDES
ncbi:MAG: cell division protein ZapA [Lachnospiraceae bacterium]